MKGTNGERGPGRETVAVETYEAVLLADGLMDFDGLVTTGLTLVESTIGFAAQFELNIPSSSLTSIRIWDWHCIVWCWALMLNAGVRTSSGRSGLIHLWFTAAQPGLLRTLQGTAWHGVCSFGIELPMRESNNRRIVRFVLPSV